MNKPNTDSAIEVLNVSIDPAAAQSRRALETGKAQHGIIRQYSGKAGKTFSYIPHTDGTKTMQGAFGQLWDWEVVKHEVFSDFSAVAYGKMTLYYYDPDGNLVHKRVIQEVGGREPITNKEGKVVSTMAFVVLGAASRSLLRCMMRAFGYGLELYREEDEEFTVEQAFKVLEEYAKTRGMSNDRDVWVTALKDAGITRENMLDRFEDAYKMVYQAGEAHKAELREVAQKMAQEKKLKAEAAKKAQDVKAKLAAAKVEEPVTT